MKTGLIALGCRRGGPQLQIDIPGPIINSPLRVRIALVRRPYQTAKEKKLVEHCQRQGLAATLPCYRSAHKYRGKTVVFRKPLFPGYVFLQLEPGQKDSVRQSDLVANLLDVFDQETFRRQLEDILLALETDMEVRLAPAVGRGNACAHQSRTRCAVWRAGSNSVTA